MTIQKNDIVEIQFPESSEYSHWNGMIAQIIAAPKPEASDGCSDNFYPFIRVLKPSSHPFAINYDRNRAGVEFRWRFPKFFKPHQEMYFSPFEQKYV